MTTIVQPRSENLVLPHRFRWLIVALLVILLVWAGISVARGANQALTEQGSIDFHTLWYYTLAGRYGSDPYEAYFEERIFQEPVIHLDGGMTDPDNLLFPMNSWQTAPGNTPVMLWLLMPLTYLSFPVAKVLWLGFNVLLLALVPWLTMTYMAKGADMPLWIRAALVLMFAGLFATRNALQVGQTTLFVMACMVGALHLAEKDRWLWAGLLLGVALSKYTLALPVVVFFLLRWEWRVLVVAGITQGIGWLSMATLGGVSLVESLQAYLAMVDSMAGQEGIHLAGVMGSSPWTILAIVLVSGVLVGGHLAGMALAWIIWRMAAFSRGFLAMWSLLIVYHRYYDMTLVMLPLTWFAVVLLGTPPHIMRRTPSWGLLGVMVIAAGVMMVPGYEIGRILLSESQMDLWTMLFAWLQTLTIIVLMVVPLLVPGQNNAVIED